MYHGNLVEDEVEEVLYEAECGTKKELSSLMDPGVVAGLIRILSSLSVMTPDL